MLAAGVLVIGLGFTVRASRQKSPDPAELRDRQKLHGAVLQAPLPKPEFTLTDTGLRQFAFREETDDGLTLLFFGYTYCPDVCPVHLANLAAVLRDMAPDSRRQIHVIFVTVDPERDTPERLREWLDAFDRRFIGLRGSLQEVNEILSDLRLPLAIHDEAGPDGNYTVGHPGQIMAFTPDGWLRVFYPFGTRQTDWAHDLPRLLALGSEDNRSDVDGIAADGESAAYVTAPIGGGPAALYVSIESRSDQWDAIVGARTARAQYAKLHQQTQGDDRMMMKPVSEIPVSPEEITRLAPGGYHVMLHDFTRPLAAGDTFTVQLRFRRGIDLPVHAVVVEYVDLERALQSAVPIKYDGF